MDTNMTGSKQNTATVTLVMMALFAALLCVTAYISIPLPIPGAPRVTLQNFTILLIALLFTPLQSFLVVLVWMLLGIVGLPVFIGGGSGIGYLLSPWGGYTMIFPVVAILLPLLRGKQYRRVRYTIATIACALLIDILGMFIMKHRTGLDLKMSFLTGFVSFLPLDLIKSFAAAQLVPAFRRLMQN